MLLLLKCRPTREIEREHWLMDKAVSGHEKLPTLPGLFARCRKGPIRQDGARRHAARGTSYQLNEQFGRRCAHDIVGQIHQRVIAPPHGGRGQLRGCRAEEVCAF